MIELLGAWKSKLKKSVIKILVKLAIIFYLGTLFACMDATDTNPLLRYGRHSLKDVYSGKAERRLIEAIVADDYETVKKLLETEVDVNVVGNYGAIPLDWTLFTDNYEMFLFLLENGADPNLQTSHSTSLMAAAAYESDHRFLEAAIAHGGDVNLVSLNDSQTPLFSAVMGRRFKNIDILLEKGANIDYRKENGDTPIIVSAKLLGFEIAYYLIEKGADPFIMNKYEYDMLYYLRKARIDPNWEGYAWREKVLSYIEEMKEKTLEAKLSTN